MPEIRIKYFGQEGEDICSLEQAGYLFALKGKMVMVEGQRIQTYAELVDLAAQEKYRDSEYIELMLLPLILGG